MGGDRGAAAHFLDETEDTETTLAVYAEIARVKEEFRTICDKITDRATD